MTSQPIEQHFRYCPRCGTENLQVGSVPFRCQQCKYSHFFGPVAAVGALIVDEENRLLLVRRARDPGKGKWGLPGGFVDREETIEQALARETMEETQLTIAEEQLLMTYPNSYDYCGIIMSVIDSFYVCRVDSPENIQLAEDELVDFEWAYPTTDHLSNMAFHSNRLAIEFWLDSTQRKSKV